MVSDNYDHIWDCCCDHGLLGFQLLGNNKVQHLHFVDIVAPLMKEIESKLAKYYQGNKCYSVHCLDAAELPLCDYPNEKHLIIIAGIGGLLLIDLLSALLPRCETLNVDFILSPVHHNYQLRQFLKQQPCYLLDEMIIEENRRFYELLHINNKAGGIISLVGHSMWNFENVTHRIYLQQTITHYQRMEKNPYVDVADIIKAYQDLHACV